jgi:hypothetical protein
METPEKNMDIKAKVLSKLKKSLARPETPIYLIVIVDPWHRRDCLHDREQPSVPRFDRFFHYEPRADVYGESI